MCFIKIDIVSVSEIFIASSNNFAKLNRLILQWVTLSLALIEIENEEDGIFIELMLCSVAGVCVRFSEIAKQVFVKKKA